MMTLSNNVKEAAKKEIQRLINAYEDLKKSGKYESFNEDETCSKLIKPLFHALGWDTEGRTIIDEVTGQEAAGGQKRVDYSFNINSQPVFFLEVKKISEDLYDPRFAEQIINYGYSKSVKWVVLSDFEGIKVFNALLKKKRLSEKTIIDLRYIDYLDKFDALWLLSKDSIVKGKLNEYAVSIGHIDYRVPINQLLLDKLLIWRDKLVKQIKSDNSKLTDEVVSECTQRILNRLIFIRTCEDRKIDKQNLLLNLVNEWQNDGKKDLDKMLLNVFREFDDGYNSNLFVPHTADEIKLSSNLLDDIIRSLYEDSKEDVKFDFATIDADIMGSIYEEYLGTIQREELTKTKRKKEGIYYTPKPIVDYIADKTLSVIIKEYLHNSQYSQLENIKVLDPACGSGSFLIKAFQIFDNAYSRTPHFSSNPIMRKVKILSNNIYGVDLDEEAVELTKLNLLLSAVTTKKKLPKLDHNIECGNSLIDNKEIAGDKAFHWDNKFKEIKERDGFDVVIGNPPYVSFGLRGHERADKLLDQYLRDTYPESAEYKLSTYAIFINKAIMQLKDNGYFGFILPDSFLLGKYFSKLRKYILGKCCIKGFVMFKEDFWKSAVVGRPTILILQKIKEKDKRSSNKVTAILCETLNDFMEGKCSSYSYSQNYFINTPLNRFRLFFSEWSMKYVRKIDEHSDTVHLGDLISLASGLIGLKGKDGIISKSQTSKKWMPGLISGEEINRYSIQYMNNYILYDIKHLKSGFKDAKYNEEKVLIRQTGDSLIGAFDDNRYLCLNNIHVGNLKNKEYNLKYILAIINSQLLNTYYQLISLEKDRVMAQTDIETLELLPIRQIDFNKSRDISIYNKIIKLVETLLNLNKQYNRIKHLKTSETDRLKDQIGEINEGINALVYMLYGLTEEEIKVVEETK